MIVADAAFDGFSRKACDKAVGGAVEVKFGKHAGNVDSFAAIVIFFARSAVGDAADELVEPHDIVYGRVECYSIDHFITSLITVSFIYIVSGMESVMMQHFFSLENVTEKTRRNLVWSANTNAI